MVREAEKSHSPPASWRTWKAGIIQSESKGPRTRSSDIQGQEKMNVTIQGERIHLLTAFFCWGPQ